MCDCKIIKSYIDKGNMAVQNLINEYITEFIFKFRHYMPFIQLLIKVKINFIVI